MHRRRSLALLLVAACSGTSSVSTVSPTVVATTATSTATTLEVTTTAPEGCEGPVRRAFEGIRDTYLKTSNLGETVDLTSESDLRTSAKIARSASIAVTELLHSTADFEIKSLADGVAPFYEAAADALEEAADSVEAGSVLDAKSATVAFATEYLEEFTDLDTYARNFIRSRCGG